LLKLRKLVEIKSRFNLNGEQDIQLRKILALVLIIFIAAGSIGSVLVLSKKSFFDPLAHLANGFQARNPSKVVSIDSFDFQFLKCKNS
jgi:hypothetical protein